MQACRLQLRSDGTATLALAPTACELGGQVYESPQWSLHEGRIAADFKPMQGDTAPLHLSGTCSRGWLNVSISLFFTVAGPPEPMIRYEAFLERLDAVREAPGFAQVAPPATAVARRTPWVMSRP